MARTSTRVSDTLAPWAEVVPDVGLMSVADYEALPDDGWVYELVEGALVRMPQSGFEASNIGYRLGGRLSVYAEDHGLGAVTGKQGGYNFGDLGQPHTELGPDVAFVRAERLVALTPEQYSRALRLAPDLAVEVASPNQWRPGMAVKAKHYLAAGGRLVWIVWPRWRQVGVWHPGDETPSATLDVGDTIGGEDVVPGFTYPVAALFHRPPPTPPTPTP